MKIKKPKVKEEYYTLSELRERFTESAIDYYFKKPDMIRPNYHRPSSKLGDKDNIKLYSMERVDVVEFGLRKLQEKEN